MQSIEGLSSFDVVRTSDVLEASGRAFAARARKVTRSLLSAAPPSDANALDAVLRWIAEAPSVDTPLVRHWIHISECLLQCWEHSQDPEGELVGHLWVDETSPARLHDLHWFRLAEAWIDSASATNDAFGIVLGERAPSRISLAPFGTLDFAREANGPLGIEWNGSEFLVRVDGRTIRIRGAQPEDPSSSARLVRRIQLHHEAGKVELPIDDPGLTSACLADAAVVRGQRAVTEWLPTLTAALDLLTCIDPRIPQEVTALCKAVLPLHSRGEVYASGSPEDVVGLVHLPAISSVEDVAESLLHEAMHQKLYRLEECVPLFASGSPRAASYFSPWRADPRPLRMVLHGAYVFTGVAEMWARLAANGSSHA